MGAEADQANRPVRRGRHACARPIPCLAFHHFHHFHHFRHFRHFRVEGEDLQVAGGHEMPPQECLHPVFGGHHFADTLLCI